jgi:plastocyanin
VAGAIDADGNPHLAYLTAGGDVKHAHDVGEGWEISDVGSGAVVSPPSIAVDAEGIHHVAWQTDQGLAYATNAEGDFAEEELPASTAEGVRPRVGAGPEGVVYLAFRDEGDTEVQMAVRSEDEPLLAVPTPEETGGGGGAPTGPPPCQPEGTELSISAQNLAFDTDCLAAPAGEPFTIEFNNQDTVPHNVAIYTDESATEVLFQEPPFPGPETVTYEPDPIEEEGNFFFRCDVHPTTMTGTFVVAATGG